MNARVRRGVFVHGIAANARIGLLPAELVRVQPLLIDIDVSVAALPVDPALSDDGDPDVDYRALRQVVADVAAAGHVRLVETLAHRVALGCAALSDTVERVAVTVRKPEALAPATAGATVILSA